MCTHVYTCVSACICTRVTICLCVHTYTHVLVQDRAIFLVRKKEMRKRKRQEKQIIVETKCYDKGYHSEPEGSLEQPSSNKQICPYSYPNEYMQNLTEDLTMLHKVMVTMKLV